MSVTVAFDKARAEGRAALIGYLPAGYPSVEQATTARTRQRFEDFIHNSE